MSAAALELQPQDEMLAAGTPALLRQQAAEVLAAHRSRRMRNLSGASPDSQDQSVRREQTLPSRSQRIASRVTERYSQSQSYRAFLAAEAEEATHKAKAAAEIAARTAQAVAEAQQKLLQELADAEAHCEEFNTRRQDVQETLGARKQNLTNALPASIEIQQERPVPSVPLSRESLTVRLFDDTGSSFRKTASVKAQSLISTSSHRSLEPFETASIEEAQALEEEITFRQSPTFDLERSSVAIPGNLLEFPRQLVAARKARPRYAEGPLCEEAAQGHDEAQLRIFEVDPAQITSTPPVESSAPEWTSIWLDALAEPAPYEAPGTAQEAVKPHIEVASLERRTMAGIVDICLVGMAFVVFASAFAYNVPVLPSLPLAAMASAGVLAGMFVLYQALFFTLSEATPGMRYARIGLCTFADENPARSAMLGRMLATLLAACPLGMGFLWACLDDEGLGWHDRLSRMYQRSY